MSLTMPSLNTDFDELIRKIEAGRSFSHTSFEPIYYFVFSPKNILEVKRQLPAWEARLNNNGWDVKKFSVAEHISELFLNAPMRSIELEADRKKPLDWKRTTESLGEDLMNGEDNLQKRLESTLAKFEGHNKVILLVTDIETLHPYLRIGAIEAQLQGKFSIPTVFFYPGTRHGRTNLRFLGFYPEDGSYRSLHVGG